MSADPRGVSVMSRAEYEALPESIRGRSGEPVGVVVMDEIRGEHHPTLIRVECSPYYLRRTRVWVEAVAERNGWSGRVRSWEERK